MIKMVMPMKRRPGMTIPEFREYYEKNHRLIGEKYLKGFASKYMRRFTNPTVDRDGELRDPGLHGADTCTRNVPVLADRQRYRYRGLSYLAFRRIYPG